jgi:hypothetical protein
LGFLKELNKKFKEILAAREKEPWHSILAQVEQSVLHNLL